MFIAILLCAIIGTVVSVILKLLGLLLLSWWLVLGWIPILILGALVVLGFASLFE